MGIYSYYYAAAGIAGGIAGMSLAFYKHSRITVNVNCIEKEGLYGLPTKLLGTIHSFTIKVKDLNEIPQEIDKVQMSYDEMNNHLDCRMFIPKSSLNNYHLKNILLISTAITSACVAGALLFYMYKNRHQQPPLQQPIAQQPPQPPLQQPIAQQPPVQPFLRPYLHFSNR